MKIISVEGIVVNATSYKESSKILNILTKDYGVIGSISKGCKSIKSKLRLISEKQAYGVFHLYYKETGLSTLIDGDIKDYFINIRSDILVMSYSSYLVDLTYNVYKQCEEEILFDMLISALKKLDEGLNPKIICNILELQYLEYLGINLNLDECVICGNKKIVTLSIPRGGYICNKCKTNEEVLDERILKMLRLYYYVDIDKISKLDIDDYVSNRINDIIDEYYDTYSGINTKSKSFLKKISE